MENVLIAVSVHVHVTCAYNINITILLNHSSSNHFPWLVFNSLLCCTVLKSYYSFRVYSGKRNFLRK